MPLRHLIVALAVVLSLVFVASAHAYVYWGNPQAGTIGRANNDGSDVEDTFIAPGGSPVAIAVTSTNIYWASGTTGTIGRANIDGAEIEPNFITEIKEPRGVAVTPTAIFWASAGGDEIGRANLNGTGKNLGLVTGITVPCSIALDSGHIYWGELESIGSAPLSGSPSEPNWVPLGTAFVPCAIAVNSANVFFGNTGFLGGGGHEIGRVGTDRSGLDKSIIGEAEDPCGMTISGSKLYWANEADGTVGVANTDATGVNEELVHTGDKICGIAVDSLSSPLSPPPSNPPGPGSSGGSSSPSAPSPPTPGTLQLVRVKPDKKHGTAQLSLAVNEAGALSVTGKGVVVASAEAHGAETLTLTVRAVKAKLPTLKRAGKLVTKLTVTFTPGDGGSGAALSKALTLRKRQSS